MLTKEATLVLGRLCPTDSTPVTIAMFAREQAEIAATLGPEAQQHVAALENFAEFLQNRGREDQRIRSMWLIEGLFGDPDGYTPGPNQRELFAKLGAVGPAPLPDLTLTELAGAALEDLLENVRTDTQRLRSELERASSELAEAEAARLRAESDAAEIIQLREELVAANGASDALSAQVEHLRGMIGDKKAPAKARRGPVTEHTGVYPVDTPEGTMYEAGVPDDTGATRWVRVGPDKAEAAEVRKQLAGKTEDEIQAAREALAGGAYKQLEEVAVA